MVLSSDTSVHGQTIKKSKKVAHTRFQTEIDWGDEKG